MSRRVLVTILLVEAIVCLIFAILVSSIGGAFSIVMAFPFEQIGLGLRTLSLSGRAGNAVAIVLYIVICLVPCAILFTLHRKNRLHMEDGLLLVLSILLFVVLYQMINPGLINFAYIAEVGLPIAKAVLGSTVYSIIFSYLILRILRLFFSRDTKDLQRYMIILLAFVNVLFVYLIFGVGVNGLIDSFKTLRESNAGNEHLLGASYVFLILQFVVDYVPYVLNIMVVFAGISLLHGLSSDRYSAETIDSAEHLAKVCRISLVITLLTNMAFNILQLIFSKILLNINSHVQIPLFSIAFVLAVLLFSRFIAENKALKDDNDSII